MYFYLVFSLIFPLAEFTTKSCWGASFGKYQQLGKANHK